MVVSGNIIQRNGNAVETSIYNCYLRYTNGSTSLLFERNLIADASYITGARVYCYEPSGSIIIRSNAFWGCNGTNANYLGDLVLAGTSYTPYTESYNTFYRVAPVGTTKVIAKGGSVYDINHIVGGTSGYWQFDNGFGTGDAISTTGPLVNPALGLTYVP